MKTELERRVQSYAKQVHDLEWFYFKQICLCEDKENLSTVELRLKKIINLKIQFNFPDMATSKF